MWKIWWWLDIVLQFSSAATAADDETGGFPPLPARVFLSFLPPGTGIGRNEVATLITVRPLIDGLCPLNPIERQGPPKPPVVVLVFAELVLCCRMGLRCRQLVGAKEPLQATDKPPFRRRTAQS